MRSPAPFSLALTRTLSVLVVLASAANGLYRLMEGERLKRLDAQFVGPAVPDFVTTFLVTLGGYGMLVFAALLLWTAIGVWRKESSAAFLLAMFCLLYAVPAIWFELTVSHAANEPVFKQRGASVSYAILLLACAIAGIKAAFDLKGVGAQPPGFPVLLPPFAAARREFEVIDDLPRDED